MPLHGSTDAFNDKKVCDRAITYAPVPPKVDDYLTELQDAITEFEVRLNYEGSRVDTRDFVAITQMRHDLVQLRLAMAHQTNPKVSLGGDLHGSLDFRLDAPKHQIVLSPVTACRRVRMPEALGTEDNEDDRV